MRLFTSAVCLAFAVGCGGDDTGGSSGPDGSPGETSDANPGCPDPTALLPVGWQPVAAVSAGAVTNELAGDTVTTTVDASAGGFENSADEPFVYVDLSGAQAAKVDIEDAASFDHPGWDLALKRYVIRSNGGDSGTGGVEIAVVQQPNLGAADTVPPSNAFSQDNFVNDACQIVLDPLMAPRTQFSDWYDLPGGGALTPRDFVYFVRIRSGALIKLEVITYYGDPSDSTRSAVFQLAWERL